MLREASVKFTLGRHGHKWRRRWTLVGWMRRPLVGILLRMTAWGFRVTVWAARRALRRKMKRVLNGLQTPSTRSGVDAGFYCVRRQGAIARSADRTRFRSQSAVRAVNEGNGFARSCREAVSRIKGTGVRLPFPASA